MDGVLEGSDFRCRDRNLNFDGKRVGRSLLKATEGGKH
jgi:hypothetical protein